VFCLGLSKKKGWINCRKGEISTRMWLIVGLGKEGRRKVDERWFGYVINEWERVPLNNFSHACV